MDKLFVQVKEKYLVRYPVQNLTTDTGQQLHTASLGLAVVADRRLFVDKRRMKLKCVASIFDIYHKINEISVEKIRRKRNQIMSESPAANQSSECSYKVLFSTSYYHFEAMATHPLLNSRGYLGVDI